MAKLLYSKAIVVIYNEEADQEVVTLPWKDCYYVQIKLDEHLPNNFDSFMRSWIWPCANLIWEKLFQKRPTIPGKRLSTVENATNG